MEGVVGIFNKISNLKFKMGFTLISNQIKIVPVQFFCSFFMAAISFNSDNMKLVAIAQQTRQMTQASPNILNEASKQRH